MKVLKLVASSVLFKCTRTVQINITLFLWTSDLPFPSTPSTLRWKYKSEEIKFISMQHQWRALHHKNSVFQKMLSKIWLEMEHSKIYHEPQKLTKKFWTKRWYVNNLAVLPFCKLAHMCCIYIFDLDELYTVLRNCIWILLKIIQIKVCARTVL